MSFPPPEKPIPLRVRRSSRIGESLPAVIHDMVVGHRNEIDLCLLEDIHPAGVAPERGRPPRLRLSRVGKCPLQIAEIDIRGAEIGKHLVELGAALLFIRLDDPPVDQLDHSTQKDVADGRQDEGTIGFGRSTLLACLLFPHSGHPFHPISIPSHMVRPENRIPISSPPCAAALRSPPR